MNMNENRAGFTVVELLVALVVTSVILSAVATLAFAMSAATRAAEDVAFTQTEVRTATLRLVELIRNCCMICASPGNDVVIWKSDDNANDVIDVNEVAYLENDDPNHCLSLRLFSSHQNPSVLSALGLSAATPVLSTLSSTETKGNLVSRYEPSGEVNRLVILRNCSGVRFDWDRTQPLPHARWLTISFGLAENGTVHHYQIEVSLLGSAAHLLNTDATSLVATDDD
jgi:prepilin-type N-terminal cleavage/methylation domain-containing protein